MKLDTTGCGCMPVADATTCAAALELASGGNLLDERVGTCAGAGVGAGAVCEEYIAGGVWPEVGVEPPSELEVDDT